MGKEKSSQAMACNRYCFRGFCEDENGPREITLENGEKIRGDWETGSLNGDSPARKCWSIHFGEPKRIVPCTISLQVGRCDRNNVSVYEGDILQFDFEYHGERFLDVFIVEWDEELCGYVMRSLVNKDSLCSEIPSEKWCEAYTIVGNKWENPELLGVTK